MTATVRFFSLRREVAGRLETHRLRPGRNKVGSRSSNDISLADSGISGHHAWIEIDGTTVTLEDLASKNGTFVNGSRARRRQIRVGDAVAFGECRFELTELPADEAELAIELEALAEDSARAVSAPTTLLGGGSCSPALVAALGGVEAMARSLCHRDGADLAGALEALCRMLAAPSAWVLERTADGRTIVVATAGAADEVSPAITDSFAGVSASQPANSGANILRPAPRVVGAVLAGGSTPAVGVWLSGIEAGEGVDALLRAAIYLIDRSRERTPRRRAGGGRVGASDLRMPEGYVPGSSPAIIELYDQMAAVAQGDLPVLLLGETGVGKEHLASMLHASSPRHRQAFIAVNCAAIPADLLEAELFGVEAGAATGVNARTGTFQRAHRGTLFLDEIGDMPAGLQAKLLRALQEQEIRPVGGRHMAIDVRVVAATNVDLGRRIEEGDFRADLYYRLAGCTLEIPPLRRRRGDIPALSEHFLRRYAAETGKAIRGMTVRAMRCLIDYRWPGNIRELEHEIRRLVYMCRKGQVLDTSMLSSAIRDTASPREDGLPPDEVEPVAVTLDPDRFNLAQLEKRTILGALEATGGRKIKAARLLGISRDALRRRLQRHGLGPGSSGS